VLSTVAFFVAAVPAFAGLASPPRPWVEKALSASSGRPRRPSTPTASWSSGVAAGGPAPTGHPIAVGAAARVVAVEGLVLEVEPEEGAARDYRRPGRSRSKRRGDADPDGSDASK